MWCARPASEKDANAAKPSPVQVVQLEEISDPLPVLAIRSDGLIRSLARSPVAFTVTGKSWYPEVYELTAGPVRKIQIWTSPEGLRFTRGRERGRIPTASPDKLSNQTRPDPTSRGHALP